MIVDIGWLEIVLSWGKVSNIFHIYFYGLYLMESNREFYLEGTVSLNSA